MKVEFEVFKPGTVFMHGFVLSQASELAVACLGRMIELWSEKPIAGAKSASGHGIVALSYDGVPSSEPYRRHLDEAGDDIRGCLQELCEMVA
jgi:hypothetical protein